jgi:hypothetical protein
VKYYSALKRNEHGGSCVKGEEPVTRGLMVYGSLAGSISQRQSRMGAVGLVEWLK